jgi:hypothetical protein
MEPQPQAETVDDLKERRYEAMVEMDVPFDDAKRYLYAPEFELFCQTLAPAADANMAGGKDSPLGDLRLDPRMIAYRAWLIIIDERKQAPTIRRQAQADYLRFIGEINHRIWQFKQELQSRGKPDFAYPSTLAAYRPGSWCPLKLPTLEEVAEWAAPHIQKKIPPDLAGLVTWNVRGEVLTLPRGRFELRGIPCLVWEFIVRVLATAQIRLAQTTFTREFRGYKYSTDVDGRELGHCYVGPESWSRQEGFAVPLVLLAALARGALEDEDVELTRQDSSSMRFLVQGYDGEVAITTRFFEFIAHVCKDRPLAEGLLAAGVIDKITAGIVQRKVDALSPPATAGVPADEASDDNSEVEAALEGMGYNKTEIAEMIRSAHLIPGMSREDKVSEALKFTQT